MVGWLYRSARAADVTDRPGSSVGREVYLKGGAYLSLPAQRDEAVDGGASTALQADVLQMDVHVAAPNS